MLKLVSNAIKAVLDDKGFEIPSSNTSDAVSSANSFLKWKQSNSVNKQLYFKFCSSLINSFSKCLPKGTAQAEREKIWGNFHHSEPLCHLLTCGMGSSSQHNAAASQYFINLLQPKY